MVSVTARTAVGNALRILRTALDPRRDGWLKGEGGTIRLGAETCELVVAPASAVALAAVRVMDRWQAGGCGPGVGVGRWPVLPGALCRWGDHPHTLCPSGGATSDIPPRDRVRDPAGTGRGHRSTTSSTRTCWGRR